MSEEEYMELALDEARKSNHEDERPHPMVGTIVVKDGKVLEAGHRGELGRGDHAEFTVLEKKLKGIPLSGAVVFTTLEPCTERTEGKTPCADRIIERGISKVYIGMLDPNPKIQGNGMRRLRSANIDVQTFLKPYADAIEELNKDFIRSQETVKAGLVLDDAFLKDFCARTHGRSLDEWYKTINRIYWDQNSERDAFVIFGHLVEVVGGISLLASNKQKNGVKPESHLAKAIAWWMAMCGKLGIKSVETLVWDKFPGVCPYCQKSPHDPSICNEKRELKPNPEWEILAEIGQDQTPPKSMAEWQAMFSKIYPAQQTEDYPASFGRFSEELGEVAEAIRVFAREPGYFLSEAADIFAWLMHILNILELKNKIPQRERGELVEKTFCNEFPDRCKHCKQSICVCSPILARTIGRITHEALPTRVGYGKNGRFLTPDQIFKNFNPE